MSSVHDLAGALAARVGARAVADAPLAPMTTLKVGGPARVLVTAESVDDLLAVGEVCGEHGAPWLVVGRGSNLLVADGGWDGVAVTLGHGFRGVEVTPPHDGLYWTVVAGAAEPMPVLARRMEKEGLGGMAFGVAIPGSVGGAVRMNAGAHGGQMADVLAWAEVVRLRSSEVERWHAEELHMGYRHTDLPDDAVVTRAALSLAETDADTLAADMEDMRAWRRRNQPINEPSCGSVFRNPPGDSAGRLIDAAGLKGYRVGGAEVSQMHANFITASKGATAADVYAVITHCRDEVARVHGVHLQTEVVLAGFDDGAAA